MNKIHLVFCIAIAAASLFGQATSQISGVIKDPSGAAVVGAEVKGTQTDTGSERTVMSGDDGSYVLAALPIGPYQIVVVKSGFKRYVQSGIIIQVASNPTVNADLKVGTVSDAVTVVADASQVETQTISISTVLENRRITELALNGRNPQELMLISAGAVPAGRTNTNGYPNGLNISVAGGQLSGISYQLDGTMYNNLIDAVSLPFPFPDALQEFKVETSTMTAKNGTHASATVSASIKSGSNRLHGGVFEFFRNFNLNARNTFASRRDTLKRNQFGGTIGGPIVKNKLFFFAGYQGTRTRSDPVNQLANVPNAQMLSGDFSGCSTFPDTIKDPTTGGTFPGKQIPISRFSPQSSKVVDFLPKSSDPCGQVSFGPITNSNDHQILGRIDYTINSKQKVYGRYMATKFAQPAPYALSGNILDTVAPGLDDLAQTAALGHTYVASPSVVNEFRFAVNRVAVQRFNKDYFSGCSVGVSMFCYFPKQTIIGVAGAFTIGANPGTPGTFFPTYLTLSNDVTVVRGSHTFALGYSSFKYQQSQTVNVTAVGNFSFLTSSTGLGLTDFLLGQVTSLIQSAPSNVYTNKWAHALYAQDTWKISRRLTLNYGLRWEPFLPQALNDGAVYNFSMQAFTAGIRSQTVVNAPPGLSYPGDPGFQGKTGVNKRWNQFAPRVGIAFDPAGNGRTSIRASGGIAYDFPNLQIMSNPTAAPPFSGKVQTNSVQFGNPYANIPNPFPAVTGPNGSFPDFGTFIAQQPDAKGPTTYTWNVSVQHQMGKDWFVSVSYLGSQSIHNWVSQALNPAILVPGPITSPSQCAATATNCNSSANINLRRLAYLSNPAANAGRKLGAVDQFESGGGSKYNGLILTTEKRLSRGVTVNVNYTWSHCIGDLTIGSYPGPGVGGGTYTDVNDRRRDRGNCSTNTVEGAAVTLQTLDRRHILNFTTVLESPRFQDRVLQRIASNWRLSSSYRFLSASYLTVTNGTDVALTGAAPPDQRANRLPGEALCSSRGSDCWINPLAFAVAATGTLGNLGRANIAGPGYFGVDMAVSRIFRLRESMSLEARGEAFNLTNSVRLNAPITARNQGTFGKIQSAQDPRIMQVALKLLF